MTVHSKDRLAATFAAVAMLTTSVWPVLAIGQPTTTQASDAPTAAPMADGEIRKIDPATGKLTIKHGEIRNLDMPPMTMVFEVQDKTLLSSLKQGDRIRFSAVDRKGKLVVTAIEPAQ